MDEEDVQRNPEPNRASEFFKRERFERFRKPIHMLPGIVPEASGRHQ
jgi:hypothetical protein